MGSTRAPRRAGIAAANPTVASSDRGSAFASGCTSQSGSGGVEHLDVVRPTVFFPEGGEALRLRVRQAARHHGTYDAVHGGVHVKSHAEREEGNHWEGGVLRSARAA